MGVTLFVGVPWGVPLGLLATLIAYYVLARMEPAAVATRRARMVADLPVAVDLLAACYSSGGTPVAATEAVSKAVGGPVGDALHRVVALLRLGADPSDAWSVLADEPTLAPLGRAVGRAVSSGAPVGVALEQLASTARQEQQGAAEEAARKVGVRATIPLGLCFLPAFVLLGVVPVAASIATTLDLW
ncbi:MAG: type II secretion system protein [Streptosporangiales bacterium]|nr:type II secretion system protein [Streptosporangiales bacterium]